MKELLLNPNLPMFLAIGIFVTVYFFIITEKIDRTLVAMAGAAAMVCLGILTQKSAIEEVDFNTIGLLTGMMIIVMIAKRSGMFEYIAVKMAKLAKGDPVKVLIYISIATGLLSAMLDNVTTIMLVLPVTLTLAKDLKVDPKAFVIAEIFASNVGGTATLIGDPPNIIIGSQVGLSFGEFLKYNGGISLLLLLLTTYIFVLIYRKKLVTNQQAKETIMEMDERQLIKNRRLMIESIAILGIVITGFLLHSVLHMESATIALAGGIILLFISGIKVEKILHEVEWKTLFFFMGLFILVGGLKATGAIDLLAVGVLNVTGDNPMLMMMAILWVSAIASAFIDNIPFVTTMIPLLQKVGELSGVNLYPMWWALSLGACLGGNGTIIGASANVIAIGVCEDNKIKIGFKEYFKVAFPVMLFTIAVCTVYLWVVFRA